MKPIMRTTGVAALALALTGCLSDGTGQAPGMTETQSGTEFIIAELDNTTDDRDAVNIDNREFNFDDQQAIDALF